MLKLGIIVVFLNLAVAVAGEKQSKIVGLVPVRNEAAMIEPCLKALALYTDAIVVLDDASEDGTLTTIHRLKDECNIAKIITKETWYRDEPGDRNLLLQAGRAIGGTHFIVIDADEMFTANLLQDQLLRKKILALQSGEVLNLTWINLWRSVDYYRYDYSVWSGESVNVAFCDDGKCFYESDFIHTSRVPTNLTGRSIQRFVLDDDLGFLKQQKAKLGVNVIRATNHNRTGQVFDKNDLYLQRCLKDLILNQKYTLQAAISKLNFLLWPDGTSKKGCYQHDFTVGLLHFQFVNWGNLLAKQAWYRCLEKIRNPKVNVEQINRMYGESKIETELRLLPCPKVWFEGYPFFQREVYEKRVSWQKQEILKWFSQYGKDFFADLDIWDIDWSV